MPEPISVTWIQWAAAQRHLSIMPLLVFQQHDDLSNVGPWSCVDRWTNPFCTVHHWIANCQANCMAKELSYCTAEPPQSSTQSAVFCLLWEREGASSEPPPAHSYGFGTSPVQWDRPICPQSQILRLCVTHSFLDPFQTGKVRWKPVSRWFRECHVPKSGILFSASDFLDLKWVECRQICAGWAAPPYCSVCRGTEELNILQRVDLTLTHPWSRLPFVFGS